VIPPMIRRCCQDRHRVLVPPLTTQEDRRRCPNRGDWDPAGEELWAREEGTPCDERPFKIEHAAFLRGLYGIEQRGQQARAKREMKHRHRRSGQTSPADSREHKKGEFNRPRRLRRGYGTHV
jgi:hypothetical protein